MTDVPGTSPERPIIWSPGRPTTGSRRRPADVPIQTFCVFVFPVKNSNRCVKQELLYLKNTFFIKFSIFVLVPSESPECPGRQDLQGTFRGRNVPAGSIIASILTMYCCNYRILKTIVIFKIFWIYCGLFIFYPFRRINV